MHTGPEPVCLPPQHGMMAHWHPGQAALGAAHSAQTRVALCIMESEGGAFDLNCMRTVAAPSLSQPLLFTAGTTADRGMQKLLSSLSLTKMCLSNENIVLF